MGDAHPSPRPLVGHPRPLLHADPPTCTHLLLFRLPSSESALEEPLFLDSHDLTPSTRSSSSESTSESPSLAEGESPTVSGGAPGAREVPPCTRRGHLLAPILLHLGGTNPHASGSPRHSRATTPPKTPKKPPQEDARMLGRRGLGTSVPAAPGTRRFSLQQQESPGCAQRRGWKNTDEAQGEREEPRGARLQKPGGVDFGLAESTGPGRK